MSDDLTDWRRAAEQVASLAAERLGGDARGRERVPLAAAAGRTLAAPVEAPEAIPAESRATMDGFALDATVEGPHEVRDEEVFPEDDPPALAAGEAVPISTGASLPEGATAVLRREDATVREGVLADPDLEPGTDVYERGAAVRAGERLFEAGEELAPRDTLLLGELEYDEVPVRERLSVALLATGTEIHEGRSRDLDSPMLAGLVRAWGHEPTLAGSVPDDPERVESRVAALAREHDVVVTTGGTSVGHKDHSVRAMRALGDVRFHGVTLRPGKPLAVADLPAHDAVGLAVPGKPVGAHTVATLVARPLFTRARDLPTLEAELARAVGVGAAGFTYAVPVTLADGTAMPLGHADSPLALYADTFDASVVSATPRATRADGVVLTAEGLERGERVSVVPYPAVER